MTTVYVALTVGCIECGVPTELLGVTSTQEAADVLLESWLAGGDHWKRYHGDGFLAVYEATIDDLGGYTTVERGRK